MEQLFDENDIEAGTGGTVIPAFYTSFYVKTWKMWNSYLRTDRHNWNGWNSPTGGRPSSLISFDLIKEKNDLKRDDPLPPQQLFQLFHPRLIEPKKLFHLENPKIYRRKGGKWMSVFVKLTCKDCGIAFLLEAENPKEGSKAKETETCRRLNIMRHGETFALHKHKNFNWEVISRIGGSK